MVVLKSSPQTTLIWIPHENLCRKIDSRMTGSLFSLASKIGLCQMYYYTILDLVWYRERKVAQWVGTGITGSSPSFGSGQLKVQTTSSFLFFMHLRPPDRCEEIDTDQRAGSPRPSPQFKNRLTAVLNSYITSSSALL